MARSIESVLGEPRESRVENAGWPRTKERIANVKEAPAGLMDRFLITIRNFTGGVERAAKVAVGKVKTWQREGKSEQPEEPVSGLKRAAEELRIREDKREKIDAALLSLSQENQ